MTITATDLLLYSGALAILFLTPGPVWLALIARGLSGGFRSAISLALGVVVGDALWPLLAVLGVTWVVGAFDGFMAVLRIVASVIFVGMGLLLIFRTSKLGKTDSRLTRPGLWAGFLAGVVVILSNPKAILFYMGVLPGFFDLTQINAADIAAIVFMSMLIPLIGNVGFALFVDRMRRLVRSSEAIDRLNKISGILLVCVGVVIPFT